MIEKCLEQILVLLKLIEINAQLLNWNCYNKWNVYFNSPLAVSLSTPQLVVSGSGSRQWINFTVGQAIM